MIKTLPSLFSTSWALLGYFIVCIFFMLLFIVDDDQRASSVPASMWPEDASIINVSFSSVDELEVYLDQSGIEWMPERGAKIPPLSLDAFPADISQVLDVPRKKSLFFRGLLPVVLLANHEIATQRKHIYELMRLGYENLNENEIKWLSSVAAWYRVEGDAGNADYWLRLLKRVDEIPAALVLAQAANESAWGGSRFAQQGNNLFGLWTYDERKGMIPTGRKEGERHAVQIFSSVRASVREYMRNLNSHRAYKVLRQARSELRSKGEPLQAEVLADGLLPYSQRGEAYVDEIRLMIKGNQLAMLQSVFIDMPNQKESTF